MRHVLQIGNPPPEPMYTGAPHQTNVQYEPFTGKTYNVPTEGANDGRRYFRNDKGYGGAGNLFLAPGYSIEFEWDQLHGAQNNCVYSLGAIGSPVGSRQVHVVQWMYRSQGPLTSDPPFDLGEQGKKFLLIYRNNHPENRITVNYGGSSVNLDSGSGESPAGVGDTTNTPSLPKYAPLWEYALAPKSGSEIPETYGTSYAERIICDGRWHRFTVAFLPSSQYAGADGWYRQWFDGQLVDDSGLIDIGSGSVGEVILASTFNGGWYDPGLGDGSPQAQREWYTNVRYWYESIS